MNYKVTEIKLREDMDEEYIELALERIHRNDNLERVPPIPQPIRVASSGSVSVNTDGVDNIAIVPEPESTEEEMAMNYIKGMRKYAPELFDTASEIKKFAPPPPTLSIVRMNYVICMDIDEYAKKEILVGDIVSIELNKTIIGPETPSEVEIGGKKQC